MKLKSNSFDRMSPRVVKKTCPVHYKEYDATECLVGGKKISTPCPLCESLEVAAERRQAELDRRRAVISSATKRAGIPKRFWAKKFGNYNAVHDGQVKALRICEAYAKNFDRVARDGACLTLLGNLGNGKTHLACAIGNEIISRGYSVLFVGAYHFFSLIKASYRKGSEKSELEVIESFIEPDLLIFEEIGVSFGSDSEKTWAYQVINRRYEEDKPTIIISNLTEDGLTEYLGERAMDRLAENGGTTLVFTWKSYRRHRKVKPINTKNKRL
jgi:DNA replication protein DnaC